METWNCKFFNHQKTREKVSIMQSHNLRKPLLFFIGVCCCSHGFYKTDVPDGPQCFPPVSKNRPGPIFSFPVQRCLRIQKIHNKSIKIDFRYRGENIEPGKCLGAGWGPSQTSRGWMMTLQKQYVFKPKFTPELKKIANSVVGFRFGFSVYFRFDPV